MITGSVNARREAVISVDVLGPGTQRQAFGAVIDTGFSEFLTLPPREIAALGLRRLGPVRMVLGDGSEDFLQVYQAIVIWDGARRSVDVHAADSDPLIGMAMLVQHELRIRVVAGGNVTVEAMP